TLLIEGGHALSGTVAVEGNKNDALPLLAAGLLTTETCVLTNVPRTGDAEAMARLLLDRGADVEGLGNRSLRDSGPQDVRDDADGRRGRRRRLGAPARRLRAARCRALRVSPEARRQRDRRRNNDDSRRGAVEAGKRGTSDFGRLHRGRKLGRRCRGDGRRS